MGRIDAAVEESSRRSAVPPDELADLAVAIKRIEALIVEGAAQGPDGSAAVERIADIAFALHEREVESSLGDELDTAVREINDVGSLKQVSAERSQQAAELLRQLSRRVHEMIAQSKADQRSAPAWKKNKFVIAEEDDEEDDTPSNGSFKTDVPEDDEFALVVAALTAALPSLAEFGAPISVPPAALVRDAAPLADDGLLPELSLEGADEANTAESEPARPPAQDSGETVIVIDSSSTVLLDDSVLPPTPSNKEETSSEDSPVAEQPVDALSDTLLEDLLRDAVRSENLAGATSAEAVTEPPPEPELLAEDSTVEALLALRVPGGAVEPTQEQTTADVIPVAAEPAPPSDKDSSSASLLPLISPDDDPGDLFDETPPALISVAAKPEPLGPPTERTLEPEPEPAIRALLAASLPPEVPLMSPAPLPQSRAAAAAPLQPVPRSASNDPLGPVRALSEEETIALFS
jgi:hypothetical protein